MRATRIGSVLLVAFTASRVLAETPDDVDSVRVLATPDGVRFALLGENKSAPAPTLFIFGMTMTETLKHPVHGKAARILARHGYLSVSLDLPCHGSDARDGEPHRLLCWRTRTEKSENLLTGFLKKSSAVLDFLIKERYTDPRSVAACGTSRGGFVALHFAAHEPRIRCAAGIQPLTDPLVIKEFKGLEENAVARSLVLDNVAGKLAGRGLWVMVRTLTNASTPTASFVSRGAWSSTLSGGRRTRHPTSPFLSCPPPAMGQCPSLTKRWRRGC